MGVAPADLGLSLDDLAPPAGGDPAAVQPDESSPPPSLRLPGSSGLTWRVATGAETPPEMSSAEVVAAYLRGEVDDDTHFWREGMISWERAHDIPELRAALVARGLSPKAPSIPPESAVPPGAEEAPSSPFSSPAVPQDALADDFDDVTVALDVNRVEHLLRESAAPPPVDDLRAPLSFDDLPSAPVAAAGELDWQRPSSHSLPLPTPAPLPTPPPLAAAPLPQALDASGAQTAAPRKSALPWVGLAAAIVGAAAMFGLYATGNFPGQSSGDGQAAQAVAPENAPEDARLANSAGTPAEAKAAVQAAAGGEDAAKPEVTQAAGTDPAAEKQAEEEAAKAQAALVAEAAAKVKAEEEAAKAELEAKAKANAAREAQLKAEIEAKAEAEQATRAAAAAKLDAEAKAVAKKQAQEATAKRAAERQVAAKKAAAAAAVKKAAAARAAKKAAEAKAAAEKAAAAPKPFSKSRASRALGVSGQSISSCKTPGGPRGSGKVKVTFSPDGVVRRALIQGSLAGTPAGGCVARLFRKTKIAPFAGGPRVVTKGFRL